MHQIFVALKINKNFDGNSSPLDRLLTDVWHAPTSERHTFLSIAYFYNSSASIVII